jgi:hypothetical protein
MFLPIRCGSIIGPSRAIGRCGDRLLRSTRPAGAAHGSDVDAQGNGTVIEQRMYQLIRQSTPVVDRQFEIEFLDPGVEVFSITFG